MQAGIVSGCKDVDRFQLKKVADADADADVANGVCWINWAVSCTQTQKPEAWSVFGFFRKVDIRRTGKLVQLHLSINATMNTNCIESNFQQLILFNNLLNEICLFE